MKQCMSKVIRKFERDERGSFSIFMTVMLSSMLLVGGSAIDIVRHETVRSSLQYNLDRAVLAAASLRQTGDVEDAAEIVRDYMSKVSSLSSFEADIDRERTQVSLTGRTVSALATAKLDTFFLGALGLDVLDVNVTSTASERIPNLEISLVLDVSNSMNGTVSEEGQSFTKISRLRSSASSFIDNVIKDIPEDEAGGEISTTTVSIVPYSTNVNLSQAMFDEYTTENLHDDNHCIIFDNNEFAATALPVDVELKQLSSYAGSRDTGSFGTQRGRLRKLSDCSTSASSTILPFSTSKTDLKAKINSLQARGSTASHIGARWGAALLDESAQPIATNLGSADASGSPKSYSEPGVLKALIIMTDGNNTSHRRLKEGYRNGLSDVYRVNSGANNSDGTTGTYYVKNSDNRFYRIRYNSYYNRYYYLGTNGSVYTYRHNNWKSQISVTSLPANATKQLTWAETWDTLTLYDYVRVSNKVSSISDVFGHLTSASQADTAMRETCEAAKQKRNVVVYTIYFGDANSDGTSNAEQLLSDCASGPGQFYNVTALDIEAAFKSIAISVQKLKLTQ